MGSGGHGLSSRGGRTGKTVGFPGVKDPVDRANEKSPRNRALFCMGLWDTELVYFLV